MTLGLKILFTGLPSFENPGDAAIATIAIKQLQEHFPNCQITLVLNDVRAYRGPLPATLGFATWFKDQQTHRWRWWVAPPLVALCGGVALFSRLGWRTAQFLPPTQWALLQAYQAADLVVSAPGGFLYSTKSGLGLLNSFFTLTYAQWLNKPVYFFPQSLGPLGFAWQRPIAYAVFNQARLVLAREERSRQFVANLGARPTQLATLPDLAFALPRVEAEKGEAWLKQWAGDLNLQQPRLGITVMDWATLGGKFQGQAQYEAALAAAARFFIQRYDGQVVLFPQVCIDLPGHDDRLPAQRLAQQLSDVAHRLWVAPGPQPYPVWQAAYAQMTLLIGTRMHSNIFAWVEDVPSLAIGYQAKTQGVAQMAGLAAWVLDIETLTESLLCEKLAALWEAQEAVRVHLAQVIPSLATQAQQAGAWMAQDFYAAYNRR